MRLDQLLVDKGLFASRSRARDAIIRGTVQVNGFVITKPGTTVSIDAAVLADDPASSYVSRAALKLVTGLHHFAIDVKGCTALDIGASTGGFTQVLLERGADHVIAVDVGHGQLHGSLKADARVINLEMLNARELVREHLEGRKINLVVSDVSFISLKLALPPALHLAEPGSHCVLLVKPQFEAGREAIGKGGILRDPKDGERAANDLRNWLDGLPGWKALGYCPSPIEGGDGNREFLLTGLKATIEK
ncbi:23S rRNA (cytidine1920-2'-O)/16S rRNA (cytidine1409-2'-O)-methyltransferase [Phyllobacterium trifolii]|uniref:23S rRNA (Cytidine1920-2'-O)/16S rRNA (Cytidine1409-2'-O)-methyltransferase n=1 Tax=Phyllobacterium trifolii TaxID=300193 RepID=A0A839U7U8_9HYPH|nr:TlyA family RNA methyltransferase [Phyllobacterium trifolii]MBB3144791.1 23S rRNA (cytidine1920-2'-O)/16S rRNA (cytidine1409-2'-O)-methyltransferase [Phyllobacterium trifolii]